MGDFVDKEQTKTEQTNNFTDFTEEQGLHFESLKEEAQEFGYRAGYNNISEKITRPQADEFLKKNPYNFSPEQNAFIFKELNKVYENYRKAGEIDRKNEEFKNEEFKDKTQNTLTYTPNAKPRQWLLNENIFIKGRPNMITGDPGAGKSTFCREYAYRLWKMGYTILYFAQEDDKEEDIDPWLVSKPEFKDGEDIERIHFFTDWTKTPIEETLKKFRHIKDKFVVVDPVHALISDVKEPAKCRQKLVSIKDNYLAEGDTLVFVNHPKTMWKEFKMSASEINASTKELVRFCRGVTILKLDKETGLNIIENSKRQLNANRYSFKVVLEYIPNKDKVLCSYSRIEDFQILKEDNSAPKPMLSTQNNLSKKREDIRKKITEFLFKNINIFTPKSDIEDHLKSMGIKQWQVDTELRTMVIDKKLDVKKHGEKNRCMSYRPTQPHTNDKSDKK